MKLPSTTVSISSDGVPRLRRSHERQIFRKVSTGSCPQHSGSGSMPSERRTSLAFEFDRLTSVSASSWIEESLSPSRRWGKNETDMAGFSKRDLVGKVARVDALLRIALRLVVIGFGMRNLRPGIERIRLPTIEERQNPGLIGK